MNWVQTLAIRKDRAKVFYAYIQDFYNNLVIESQRRGLPAEWCTNPLDALLSRFEENLNRATRSAMRLNPDKKPEDIKPRNVSGVIAKLNFEKKFGFVKFDDKAADGYISSVVFDLIDWTSLSEGSRVKCVVVDRSRGPSIQMLEPE